jgi:iron complex outermembrane receptor protein
VNAPAPAASEPQRIVIEGQRREDTDAERRDATLAMDILGREELDRHGDLSLLDVLARLPGFAVEGESVRLRGLGPGYTQILINGEPAPPGFSLDQLPPSQIERVEVVKGPSAEFGGVAGTINIVLRGPTRLQQREVRAGIGWRALQPFGNFGFAWGDRVGAVGFQLPFSSWRWANASAWSSERTNRLPTHEVRGTALAGRDESRGGGASFNPRLDWKISDTDSTQLQLFWHRNEPKNLGRFETQTLLGPPPGTLVERTRSASLDESARAQLQWQHRTQQGRRVELRASGQSAVQRSASEGAGFGVADMVTFRREIASSQRETRHALAAKWREPLAAEHALVLGVEGEARQRRELRRWFDLPLAAGGTATERLTPALGRPFEAAADRLTAFVQHEARFGEAWSGLIGLRAERWRVANASHDAISPSLNLRRRFDAQGQQQLRIGIARSVRWPDLPLLMPRYNLNTTYDRTQSNTPVAADSAGNPALGSERATALDLAWEFPLGAMPPAAAGRSRAAPASASVSVFGRRIDGLIRRRIGLETVPEADAPRWVSRPVNLGRAHSHGIELSAKGAAEALLPGLDAERASGLTLRAALSLYRSRVELIDDPDARLENQAPWSVNLGLDRLPPGGEGASGAASRDPWRWGLSVQHTPAYSTQQSDSQRVWRGRQTRLDAYLGFRPNRQTQWRFSAQYIAAPDIRSRSSVFDLDGFAATSSSRREQRVRLAADLVQRF